MMKASSISADESKSPGKYQIYGQSLMSQVNVPLVVTLWLKRKISNYFK